MTLAGMPGSQVSNDGDIMRMIADLQRQYRELAAQDLLTPVGITAQPNGITVTGTETVNGPLNVNGTTTIAGPMNVSGDTTFSGNTTIGGNASVTGNVTKSNSWGSSSLGPIVFGTSGSPGLSFTKNGTTYGSPAGIGLVTGSPDVLLVSGPSTTSTAGYFELTSNKNFTIASDADGSGGTSLGPSIASTAGANGALSLYSGSTNGSIQIWPNGTGKCQVNGAFAVTGSKAFIMQHPLDPERKTLMHASTESPWNGVEYWDEATTGADGTAEVALPAYFEALTKQEHRNIQLTPVGGPCVTVPWASRIIDGKFTINAPAGTTVSWVVKAERHRLVDSVDALAFEAEQDAALT